SHERLVQLIYTQDSFRDRVCFSLLGRLGLRKEALRLMQAPDIRRTTRELGVRGKGRGSQELPHPPLPSLAPHLHFLFEAEEYRPRDYLLYPREDRTRPMDRSSVHRWFKRCLDRAGLPDMPMHELRHSAADFTRRATSSYVAKDLLGHQSIATTETYLHS